ncbi:glycosyltransferase [Dactylosporangium cerinum]|uniref:Glycosyltransferase n=1 Tax=Dactylosporangium cerinum TaxID=1434730 RepID=A0ABV9VSE3_9ACTN
MATVSLCMIVKNEEAFLRGCLESAAPAVDEMVVVDTGSTDATMEIAVAAGAVVLTDTLDGDFAKARNRALDAATSDWILVLDADERLPEAAAASVRRLASEAGAGRHAFGVTRYNFFPNGGFYTDPVVRLFRRDPGIRYHGRVAETVAPSLAESGRGWAPSDVVLNHNGFSRPIAVRDAKLRMYLGLLQGRLDTEGDNPFLLMQIALSVRRLGRFEESLDLAQRAVAASDDPELAYLHGHVLRSAGRDRDALAAFTRAAEGSPEDGVAANMVGVLQLTLGDEAAAEQTLSEARSAAPHLDHITLNLGLLRQAQGRWADAVALFREVIGRNPGFLIDEWAGRLEADPHRNASNETIYGYAGLPFHLAYCLAMAEGRGKELHQ